MHSIGIYVICVLEDLFGLSTTRQALHSIWGLCQSLPVGQSDILLTMTLDFWLLYVECVGEFIKQQDFRSFN